MVSQDRDLEILLVDYADALRDGTIPTFLKSLSRNEAQTVARSEAFDEAASAARSLCETHFFDRVAQPNMSLFIARVDAEIAGRDKQSRNRSGAGRGERAGRGGRPRYRVPSE